MLKEAKENKIPLAHLRELAEYELKLFTQVKESIEKIKKPATKP